MRSYRWRITLVVTIFALLGSIAVFAGAQDAAQQGGILRIAINPIEGTLDPAFSSNNPDASFNHAIYDFLVEPLPDGTVGPNLAESWEISEDGLTYSFNLREGVSFHDGTPFTSADVAFTFNRLRDEELGSPAFSLLSGITEIATPDDLTVVFTLAEPNVDFLTAGIGSRFTLILKDGTEDPNDTAQIIGTGPFRLVEYRPQDRAVLTRNEGYWQEGLPLLDGMEHIYVADTSAQAEQLRSGEADFIYSVPIELAVSLRDESDVTVVTVPSSQHNTVRIHADEGPGADLRVRQAFKLATDRNLLNDLVLFGLGTVANNDPIGPVYGNFYPGDAGIEHDPARACELLAEAGFPDGLEMTLRAPDSLEIPTLATALQQQWQEGCINVEVEIVPVSIYYADGENNWLDAPLGITGWGFRPTPQEYLDVAYQTGGRWNEGRWSDPEVDALIDEARQTLDEDERAEVFAELSALINERSPVIIPYFQSGVGAFGNNVGGLNLHPFVGLTDFRSVFLTNAE